MRSRVTVIVLVCCVAAAVAVAGSPAPAGAQTTPTTATPQPAGPRRVLVYGDSLTWEAQAGIEQAIEAQLPGWDAIVRTSPGVATCDTLPAMRAADGALNPSVVVLEYVAVPFGPCMTGKDSLAQHTADTQTALALWASRGVPVVLVGAPRGVGDPIELAGAAAINHDLAARAGQTFVDTGVLLRDPWTGVYQQRLPCLAGETATLGCGSDGLIDVRDETGGHFCSIHNVGPCPVYASGIVRFAAPIAGAVVQAARTGTSAALPGPPADPALGPSVRALLAGSGAIGGTKADRRAAAAARLADDGVPADFAPMPITAAAPTALAGPECRALRRAVKETTADGDARAEASFAAPGGGATIDEVVHVLPDARGARALVQLYAGRPATRCFQHTLGVPVTVERTTGRRAVTTLRATASRPLVVQIARSGRSVTALAYANAATPPPEDTLAAITQAAVAKAGAAVVTDSAR